MILVGLIANRADRFADQWSYINSLGLKVGRVQNLKNWSLCMVADPQTTGMGTEYSGTEVDDAPLEVIRAFLAGQTNLQTIGRSGVHGYDNMDHSLVTAILAVRNWLGEKRNLWSVATEQSHHEARIGPPITADPAEEKP